MNNRNRGTKRQCKECGEFFYDLKRTKIPCPKCNAPFVQPKALKELTVKIPNKDISAIGHLSRKFGLSYEGLVHAHADDSKRLGSLLRKMKGRERPSRDNIKWLQGHFGHPIVSKYPSISGLAKVLGENSVTYVQGEVNHVGRFEAVYFDDYYPTRTGIKHIPSQRLLDFKEGDSGAVDFYASKVLPHLRKGIIVCCAPSSTMNQWGKGLVLLLSMLSRDVPCVSYTDLICRTVNTKKRSFGGDRSFDNNLASMKIIEADRCKDKDVVVVDDIVTTGSTLCACAELLWLAQVASVSCLTMGKTIDTREKDTVLSAQMDL